MQVKRFRRLKCVPLTCNFKLAQLHPKIALPNQGGRVSCRSSVGNTSVKYVPRRQALSHVGENFKKDTAWELDELNAVIKKPHEIQYEDLTKLLRSF